MQKDISGYLNPYSQNYPVNKPTPHSLLKVLPTCNSQTLVHFIPTTTSYLCDVLSWENCVSHIPSARRWGKYSTRRKIGEVWLDLWQWGGRHNKPLLWLACGDYLWSCVDWFWRHLQERKQWYLHCRQNLNLLKEVKADCVKVFRDFK